jgi:hypothetical protein
MRLGSPPILSPARRPQQSNHDRLPSLLHPQPLVSLGRLHLALNANMSSEESDREVVAKKRKLLRACDVCRKKKSTLLGI